VKLRRTAERVLDSPRHLFDSAIDVSFDRNFETVAGHVETDAVRARAAPLGVDYGQGFFIGNPSALDDVIHDLPLYACFTKSTGLVDPAPGKMAVLGG
jgi:EAL domain-containing protein (putative c-di-GMP-specific phosphodiesterase class I)